METRSLVILPIHARQHEVVDIYWHTDCEATYVQRVTCPPEATLTARLVAHEEHQFADDGNPHDIT